jgi:ferritin-like metal-binding protein YciE
LASYLHVVAGFANTWAGVSKGGIRIKRMADKQLLVAWLNDAYAMEMALVPILENHAKDANNHPAIEARDREHAEQTRKQAERIKGCLERLGEKPSKAKAALGSLFGYMQAPMTGMFSDELVKNFLMDYAIEHFEIACYEALITASEQLGENEIASVCRGILQEEQEMADWIRDFLPTIVSEHCQQPIASRQS